MKYIILYFSDAYFRMVMSAFLSLAIIAFFNHFSFGQSNEKEPEYNILIRELAYKEVNEEELTLNIYSSAEEGAASNLPIVVFFHGGGYTRGSKNDVTRIDFFHHTLFTLIEENKINVVSIDFRNADENTAMPDIIADCKDALHWLGSNAEEYGIDAQKIGLIGHSTGAHLALISGLITDASITDPPSSPEKPYYISCIIGLSPLTDFLREAKESKEAGEVISQKMKNTLEYLFGGKYNEVPERYEKASPINYLNNMSPPTFLFTGTKDKRLRDNAQWFKDAGDNKGAKVNLIVVEKAGHRIYDGGADISPSLPEISKLIQEFIVDTFYPDDTKVTL